MKKKTTVNKCLPPLIYSRVFTTANTSRVDLTEALLESQEPQILLYRKAIVFEACGQSPVTTADEKENHRQQVFATPHLL